MALTTESIIRLPTHKKVLILVLVVALIFALFWQLSYKPQRERIARKEKKLAQLINERNVKRKLAAQYDKYKAELKVIRERLKEVVAKLPEKKEIPLLLKSISNIGKGAGLDIVLFKPKGEQLKEFYAEVPFELKFVGGYHQIGLFFYNVGKLPRIVSIKDFTVTRAKAEGEEVLLQATCLAATYRFVEQPKKKGATGSKKAKRTKKGGKRR